MKLKELKATLALHPDAIARLILPDGDEIPGHFHITEVGHITKRFIDCGGKIHEPTDTCLLQTWIGDDDDHRLKAGTFAKILQLGDKVLPHDDMEVAVEYDCCVVAQYPIASAHFTGTHIDLQLGAKRTACLARERRQSEGSCCGSSGEAERAACC